MLLDEEPMTRVRKTRDVFDVEARYPGSHGWEVVCAEDTRDEARIRLREYRENDTHATGLRVVKRRERIEPIAARPPRGFI